MKKITKHLPHYLSLIGIFMAGVYGFFYFSFDKYFQIAIAIALAFSYVSWGIMHHTSHKDLYLEVAIEYIVIASLGLVVILSLILRA